MNDTQLAVTDSTYNNYQLGHIRISVTNRKRFNEAALQELAENIKEVGIIQPILIRPVTPTKEQPQAYEIVAGERRYRAASIAGMGTIPAICRILTDKQAREIQLLENLQRENPHPMEEAEGFQELMLASGYNADQLVDKLKKSRSYIYGRLKLCALTLDVREQFLDDEISASTALLIARIPVPLLQIKALGEILHPNGMMHAEPMSYRRAVDHIQTRYMLDLSSAPFSITDAKLHAYAGACTFCPKRTGNQPVVFADVSADVCTDPDCFAEKRAETNIKVIVRAQKNGIPVYEGDEAANINNQQWGMGLLIKDNFPLWKLDRVAEQKEKEQSIGKLLAGGALPFPAAYTKDANGTATAWYDRTAIQSALEKAGLCMTVSDHARRVDRESASPEHKAALEKQTRSRDQHIVRKLEAEKQTADRIALYKRLRQKCANKFSVESLRAMTKVLFMSRELSRELSVLYGPAQSSEEAMCAHIDQASLVEVQLILMDLIIGEYLPITVWELDGDGPDYFDTVIAMAAFEGVDIDEVAPADQAAEVIDGTASIGINPELLAACADLAPSITDLSASRVLPTPPAALDGTSNTLRVTKVIDEKVLESKTPIKNAPARKAKKPIDTKASL